MISPETWVVKVFHDNGTLMDTYYFANKADVEASIVETWSQLRGSVQMTSGLQTIIVLHLGTGQHLLFAQRLGRVEVLTRPTHF